VSLVARPPADATRLAEVKKELLDVQTRFGQAKTADDRTALRQRMVELMAEQKELEGGASDEDEDDE
jgi:hypothetical protein